MQPRDTAPPVHERRTARRAARRAVLLLLSGLFACFPPGTTLAGQELAVDRSIARDPLDADIAEAAERFGIPAAWIRAVMRVESAGNRAAVSPKGAMGLMQIMPATWDDLSSRHALGRDPFDPRANILAGAAYLRELHDRYGSPGFLAAYNAGPGRYEASLNGRPLPLETVRYVATLAPAINGRAAPDAVRLAVADPQSWRGAALFVARTARRDGDRADSIDGPGPAMIAQPGDRTATPAEPRRGGLFVARPHEGDTP